MTTRSGASIRAVAATTIIPTNEFFFFPYRTKQEYNTIFNNVRL